MTTMFRTFVAQQAIAVAVFNAVINASYTSWLWSARDSLPLSGGQGIGIDIAMTPVVIAVLSTLLGTSSIRQKLRDGRVGVVELPLPLAWRSVPYGHISRALAFGFVAALLFAMPTWLILQSSSIELSLQNAVLAKVFLTVVMSVVIVPVVILAGLSDVLHPRGPTKRQMPGSKYQIARTSP
jgi:hypothetical protein